MAWLHWFADAGDGSSSPNSKQRSMFGAGLPHATAVPAKASRLRRAGVKYGAIAAVVCILYTFAPGAAVVAPSPSDTTTALPAAAAVVAAVPSSASSQAAASSWLSHGTAMLRQHFGIGGSQGRELAANATWTCGQQLMVRQSHAHLQPATHNDVTLVVAEHYLVRQSLGALKWRVKTRSKATSTTSTFMTAHWATPSLWPLSSCCSSSSTASSCWETQLTNTFAQLCRWRTAAAVPFLSVVLR